MDSVNTQAALMWPAYLQGFALSFGLIVAIGAQNAFVLRKGLRREHVGSVVLFCSVADAVLIMAGVYGMALARAVPASPGSACWASAHAGWRPGSPGRGRGSCWTA